MISYFNNWGEHHLLHLMQKKRACSRWDTRQRLQVHDSAFLGQLAHMDSSVIYTLLSSNNTDILTFLILYYIVLLDVRMLDHVVDKMANLAMLQREREREKEKRKPVLSCC